MTQLKKDTTSTTAVKIINAYIDKIKEDLWILNQQIHNHPETAFEEHFAHDTITSFLERHGQTPTRHAYGLDTAFEAHAGRKGRLVNFNAEYDALPGLGHACGHNLICVASVAAYLALGRVLEMKRVEGRVQLLGTPAEEGGGGKIILLQAGAYEGVDVSLMAHPSGEHVYKGTPYVGISGQPTLAAGELLAEYTGRSAHAAFNPWDGINALDAVVASYNNISLLRQQLHPDERVHGAIVSAPKITNAIPSHTAVKYTIRSGTLDRFELLAPRVRACLEAAAHATGCSAKIGPDMDTYADVRPNLPLAVAFADYVAGHHVPLLKSTTEPITASTDQGNITHALPGLHAIVGVPASDETALPHNPGFEKASGTREAFERFVAVAKALAATGAKVLLDDRFFAEVRKNFDGDKEETCA